VLPERYTDATFVYKPLYSNVEEVPEKRLTGRRETFGSRQAISSTNKRTVSSGHCRTDCA